MVYIQYELTFAWYPYLDRATIAVEPASRVLCLGLLLRGYPRVGVRVLGRHVLARFKVREQSVEGPFRTPGERRPGRVFRRRGAAPRKVVDRTRAAEHLAPMRRSGKEVEVSADSRTWG